jgi:hypothetical protein
MTTNVTDEATARFLEATEPSYWYRYGYGVGTCEAEPLEESTLDTLTLLQFLDYFEGWHAAVQGVGAQRRGAAAMSGADARHLAGL